MTRFQMLALTTVIATLVLITVGSVVRTTGSGLGCPDWPLCQGRVIPPAERTAIIEWSHRTVASVVGLLIVATALTALYRHRTDTTMRALAIVVLPLLALQAWLGKETVERELPAEVVAIHLSTALLLFALVSLVAAFAFLGPRRQRIAQRDRATLYRLGLIASAIVGGVLVLGSYVVGSKAGFACTDWPGCPQASVPFLDGQRLQHVQWLHRLTVVVGLAATAGFAYYVLSVMRDPGHYLRAAAWALLALYGAQILVGALIPWTDFSEAARVAHLAVGSAIWGLLVVATVASRYQPAPQARPLTDIPLGTEAVAARGAGP